MGKNAARIGLSGRKQLRKPKLPNDEVVAPDEDDDM